MKLPSRLTLLATALFVPAIALADDPSSLVKSGVCNGQTGFDGCNKTLFGTGSIFTNITNTLIFIVGAISVIMVVVGGLRLATSGGNPSNVKAARETILYALVGVVVAVFSFAIVNFVLKNIT